MQILTETILPSQNPLIVEQAASESGMKFYYLKGLFLQGETRNQNGRIYPRNVIEKAVNDLNERIKTEGPIAGELDHPETLTVNFDRIAVAITEMHMDGDNGFGTMRVVPAGLGLIVEGAIKAGIRVGVSSRGSGDLDSNKVVTEYDIVTVDAVLNPSAKGARPAASLAESVDSNANLRDALTLSQFVREDPQIQKYVQKEIIKFLSSLKD